MEIGLSLLKVARWRLINNYAEHYRNLPKSYDQQLRNDGMLKEQLFEIVQAIQIEAPSMHFQNLNEVIHKKLLLLLSDYQLPSLLRANGDTLRSLKRFHLDNFLSITFHTFFQNKE